jgi:muconolactone delta-isomerase
MRKIGKTLYSVYKKARNQTQRIPHQGKQEVARRLEAKPSTPRRMWHVVEEFDGYSFGKASSRKGLHKLLPSNGTCITILV